MIVMVLDHVPAALKGELTRWLIEVKPGVYIGHVNAMVRDKLWERCREKCKKGSVFQAWSTNTEQHYQMRIYQDSYREVRDWEGLMLITELKDQLTIVQKKRIRKIEH